MIIKVCGMRNSGNIKAVEELPIQWMGFIFHPLSPRFVEIPPSYLPTRVKRVGVFVNADDAFIQNHTTMYGLDIIQLHGKESPQDCDRIRKMTGKTIVKAFGIKNGDSFLPVSAYENHADYFIFDTYCNSSGGSGKRFDHILLNLYTGNTPFLLSGGIGENDAEEIRSLRHPLMCGVDLNSRFELSPALKSTEKLQIFIHQLNRQ